MASLSLNPLDPDRFGRLILVRRGNQVYLARPPRRKKGPLSSANLGREQRFREANAYTTAIMHHPERRAAFAKEAKNRDKPIFAVVMSHFLKRPVIADVTTSDYHGRVGDVIIVRVRHDLPIVNVHVALRRANDTLIEEGDSIASNDGHRYAATTNLPAGTELRAEITVRDADGLEVRRPVCLVVG